MKIPLTGASFDMRCSVVFIGLGAKFGIKVEECMRCICANNHCQISVASLELQQELQTTNNVVRATRDGSSKVSFFRCSELGAGSKR